jgi:hypothetical protein
MTRLIEFVGGGPLDGVVMPDVGDERVSQRDGEMVYIYDRWDAWTLGTHVMRLSQVLPIGDERRRRPTGP